MKTSSIFRLELLCIALLGALLLVLAAPLAGEIGAGIAG